MNSFVVVVKKRLSKKNINSRQEALVRNCFEQFEKLLSKGLSLPIRML
jgi:hypothetical protein